MESLEDQEPAEKKEKEPEVDENVKQRPKTPEDEMVRKLNALAKTILFRNLRKEKKDDPL
jgi:hypothetical protein